MATTKEKTMNEMIHVAVVSRWVLGGKIASRSLDPDTFRTIFRLDRLRVLLQRIHGVRLPCVARADWSTKSLKDFCDDILSPDCFCHEWRTSLLRENHASLRVRAAVASSLFLFRKVIPQWKPKSVVKKEEKNYIKKMTTEQPPPSAAFLSFARRTARQQFREGWDNGWLKLTQGFTLPTSSCVESKRSQGGPRGLDRAALRSAYSSFVEGKYERDLSQDCVPMTIWTGGKWRLVTKFRAERSFLAPVHKAIYNHLSKKPWLLRGEATPDRFEDFTKKDDEVFVSGDYESATDNLNLWVTRALLQEIRSTSRHIPRAVWDAAELSLVNRFPDGKVQARGQLMGSLLSFPLLCLTNFIAFKWAVPRKVPLRINGDDIVFRCTQAEKEKWFKEIETSGLRVSKGKTLVSKNVFSLNSTFFVPTYSGVEVVKTVRSTCLFGQAEEPSAVSGRLASVYTGSGAGKDLCQAFSLREMSKQIWSSQRSVRRGLNGKVSWRALKGANLKVRECFYNGLATEKPLPPRKNEWRQNAIPEGYSRVPSNTVNEKDDPDFYQEMVECCWSRDPIIGKVDDSYWRVVREGTFRYVPQIPKRFGRMAGFSDREFHEFSSRLTRTAIDKRKLVWVKDPQGVIAFQSGGLLDPSHAR